MAEVCQRLLSHQPAVRGERDPQWPADYPLGSVVVACGELPDELGPGAVPAWRA